MENNLYEKIELFNLTCAEDQENRKCKEFLKNHTDFSNEIMERYKDLGNMTEMKRSELEKDLYDYINRKIQDYEYLGKEVDVEMDRPIGTIHPKHPDVVYPVNYGYIPGVYGGDGEELDVYFLSLDEPVKSAHGRVIGIVHRLDDNEDKLIAAPIGKMYTKEEMEEAVHFQEKFHNSYVEILK